MKHEIESFNSFGEFLNKSQDCQDVNLLNNSDWRCTFVKRLNNCHNNDGFISYITFAYCSFGSEVLAVIILCLWLIILFIAMGLEPDDFLCPSLLVVSRTLRLSPNVAGVTLLAFGNGISDIFTSVAAVRQSQPQLVISELIGAGIFLTTIVAGIVFIVSDFKVKKRPIIKDISFYIVAVFLIWIMCFTGKITIKYSIAFICLYIFYVIIVIISGIIYAKFYVKEYNGFVETNIVKSGGNSHINKKGALILVQYKSRRSIQDSNHCCHRLPKKASISNGNSENSAGLKGRNEIFTIEDKNANTDTIESKSIAPPLVLTQISHISQISLLSDNDDTRISQWKELLIKIIPIDYKSWKTLRWYSKIFAIIKAPIYFIFTITIPVVDEEKEKNNWCKILNIIHIIIGPQIGLLLTQVSQTYLIEGATLVVSIIVAIIVYFTSNYEHPPVYHSIFAYFGFILSIVWIYALANEIIAILQTIGVIFDLSDDILGLTVLAWGNSITDLVTNISLARHGHPLIAIFACFGAPFFNTLLGIGIPYTALVTSNGEPESLQYSRMITLFCSTMAISLASTLVFLIFNRFQSKRWHGFYLIALYIIYTTLALLIEFSAI